MAGSFGSHGSSDFPDTGTHGWTPDGDTNPGFGIVEEGDDDYKDDDF